MTTYVFNTLPAFAELPFDPSRDVLDFTGSGVTSFAQISIGDDEGDNGGSNEVSFFTDTRFLFLQIEDPLRFTSANFIFDGGNASKILIGDNSIAFRDDDLANTLIGGAGNDLLAGLGGNDSISGGDGNDFIVTFRGEGNGTVGNDTIDGGNGFDQILFRDIEINGVDQTVSVNLASGTYSIGGAMGTGTVLNVEAVIAKGANDTLVGSTAANYLNGAGGNDSIDGGSGDDTLFGGSGNDTILGGLGNDLIRGGFGTDSVDGGAGNDTYLYFGGSDLISDSGGTDTAITQFSGSIQNFSGVENLTLVSGVGFDVTPAILNQLYASSLDVNSLIPELIGNSLANVITGNDRFNLFLGGAGNDTFVGNGGFDIAEYDSPNTAFNPTSAISVTFTGGGSALVNAADMGIDSLSGIEGLVGSHFDDSIDGGTSNDDQLFSAAGGNDTVIGGGGNDTISGDQGYDSIDGGTGSRDMVDFTGVQAGIVANLASQSVSNDGRDSDNNDGNGFQPGSDTLANIEDLVGGEFNDSITGSDTDNRLWGGAGNDTIIAGAGDDSVDGGKGNFDWAYYNANASGTTTTGALNINLAAGTVSGGELGNDVLSNIEFVRGGDGADTFTGGNPNLHPGIYFWSAPSEGFEGGKGTDSIVGASGDGWFTSLRYSNDSLGGSGVVVNLGTGTATDGWGNTDTFVNVDGIQGSSLADTLIGGSSSANFFGQLYESFNGGAGSDSIDGAGGFDLVDYIGAPSAVYVNLSSGISGGVNPGTATDGFGGTDTLAGIEWVRGSTSGVGDTLIGSSGNNVFEGVWGNDSFDGGAGNDLVQYVRSFGGVTVNLFAGTALDGFDSNSSSAGIQSYTDTFTGIEGAIGSDFSDFFVGVAGQDNYFDGRGGARQDTQPFANSDTVDYSQGGHTNAITVNLATGLVNDGLGGTDTLVNIEAVFGTAGNDSFTGSNTSLTYEGLLTDRNERFRGAAGNDTIDGGSSAWGDSDQADYSGAASAVFVDLRAGTATGGAGNDVLINIDNVVGSNFNDVLMGGSDSRAFSGTPFEVFRGGAGNDTIYGNDGWNVADYTNATTGITVTLFDFGNPGIATDGQGGTDQLWNINYIRGGQFNDNLVGSNGSSDREIFEANAGDDFIDGRGDLDITSYRTSPNAVYVDLGHAFAADGWGTRDTLANIEGARGSDFDDTLIGGYATGQSGSNGWQVFEGGAGNDLIDGADGFDNQIPGSIDNDLDVAEYRNAPGAVLVDLVAGTAQDGYGGTDTLVGIEGAFGSRFGDTIIGGNTSSTSMLFEGFDGRAGNDSLVGGAGNDFLFYDETETGVIVNLSSSSVVVDGDTVLAGTARDGWGSTDSFSGMEHVDATEYGDVLIGSAADNELFGEGGDDILRGGGGNDTLDGGDGNFNNGLLERGLDVADYSATANAVTVNLVLGQALAGADANDLLTRIEGALGSAFADTLIGDLNDNLFAGGAGNDSIFGGGGNDWVSFENDPGGALVHLDTQVATDGFGNTDALRSIENARGGAFNDTLYGSFKDNIFEGGLGNDSIVSGVNNGSDTLTYASAAGAVAIDLIGNTIGGAAGDDTLSGTVVNVIGSQFADTITGATLSSGQRQYLDGGAGGNDSITGGGTGDGGLSILSFRNDSGNINYFIDFSAGSGTVMLGNGDDISYAGIDGVVGSQWSDSLKGGAGNDYLDGGINTDTLDGGAGIDLVSYRDAFNPVFVNLSSTSAPMTVNGYVDAQGITQATQTVAGGQALEDDSNERGSANFQFDSLSNLENVEGGAYNDTLVGAFNQANLLMGGGGNDSLQGGGFSTLGGPFNDSFIGGSGVDWVGYSGLGSPTPFGTGIVANLQAGTVVKGAFGTDSVSGIENVFGTPSADSILGANQVYTGLSHDNVFGIYGGGGGNDTLSGASAADGKYDIASYNGSQNAVTVNFGAGFASDGIDQSSLPGFQFGTDTLINIDDVQGSAFNDTLIGGSGSRSFSGHLFESFRGNAGNDSIDGGSGEDRADYRFSTGAVNVNLATGVAADGQGGTDTLVNIENVRGSLFSDTLTGGGTQNAGTIYDFEVFEGMEGNDSINGGAGNDIASYYFSDGPVIVNLSAGTINPVLDGTPYAVTAGTALDGFGTKDTLVSIEGVIGSDYADYIRGSDTNVGVELFRGGAGNDTIDGGAGNDAATYEASPGAVYVDLGSDFANDGYGYTDTLTNIEGVRGSIFADTLYGGSGNETIEGGQGNDFIDGGGGNQLIDYFRDQAPVTVTFSGIGSGTAIGAFSGTDSFTTIESVRGTGFGDSLLGGAGNQGFDGFGGDDSLVGGAGNDTLDGGAGNDLADYSAAPGPVSVNLSAGIAGADGYGTADSLSNIEAVRGTAFNDTLIGGAGNETLTGGAGNDSIDGGAGAHDAASYAGAAAGIVADLGLNQVVNDGDGGNDTLAGVEDLEGGAFGDSITGSIGANRLLGGAGNDTFTPLAGNDTIDGGAGNSDTVVYSAVTQNMVVDLGVGTVTIGAEVDVLTGIEVVLGGSGNDSMAGTVGRAEALDAGDGNDTFQGGGTLNDTYVGGAGFDQLLYGPDAGYIIVDLDAGKVYKSNGGIDSISGIESVVSNLVTTYVYNNLTEFTVLPFDARADVLDFSASSVLSLAQVGLGDDEGDDNEISLLTDERFLFLQTQDPERFTEATFIFPDGGKFLIGDNAITVRDDDLANTLTGGAGNDLLAGLGGNDSISAGGGDDLIMMFSGDNNSLGSDTIDGGGGFDVINFSDVENNNLPGAVSANLGAGTYSITLVTGFDSMGNPNAFSALPGAIAAGSIEALVGGGGNDTFTGNAAANYLNGGGGNDTIDGGDGNDSLFGGTGNDTLQGGLGDDLVRGGFGADSGSGGAGNDTYVFFTGNDTISDSGGTDTAITQFSNTLGGASGVDNLTLAGNIGPASTEATFVQFFSGDYNDDDNPFFGLIAELGGNSLANVITGNDQFNLLIGGGGNDTLVGAGGLDIAEYDSPDSSLVPTGSLTVTFTAVGVGTATAAGTGTDVFSGIEGAVGGQFSDSIDGGAAVVDHQIFIGANGNDTILGGGGNDTIFGQAGNDSLDGGTGSGDVLGYFDADTSVTVDLGAGTVANDGRDNNTLAGFQGGTDSISGFEGAAGGIFGDTLIGNTLANRLWGGAGNDTITGGIGNDTIDGGTGIFDTAVYSAVTQAMTVNLATGTVSIAGGEVDSLVNIEVVLGGTGNDTMLGGGNANPPDIYFWSSRSALFEGGAGDDSIDGVDTTDGYFAVARYDSDTAGVNVNLGTGLASGSATGNDTLANIDGVIGGSGNDILVGGGGSKNLDGNLFEFFIGGLGNDSIDGAGGIDRIDYNAGPGPVLVDMGNHSSSGGQGNDSFSNIEGVRGSGANDTLIGDGANNFFEGMNGFDSIDGGGGGNDIVRYDRSFGGVTVNLSSFTIDSASDGFDSDGNSTNGIQSFTDTLVNIEGASGSDFSDFFIGQSGQNNYFNGRGGARVDGVLFVSSDTVDYSADAGPITVNLATGLVTDGGAGTDTLVNIEAVFGTAYGDSMRGSDTSLEYTGLYTDRGERFRGNDGNDTIDGGNSAWGSQDTVDYSNATTPLYVNLGSGFGGGEGGPVGSDFLINIDGVNGGSGNDSLVGGSDSRVFSGSLFEIFRGGAGNDTIDGQDGVDTADYSSAPGAVSVNLGSGSNSFNGFNSGTASDGQSGTDVLISIEQVRGGQFNDTLVGGGDSNGNREVFRGNAGDDFIDGRDNLDVTSYASSPVAVYVDLGRGFALDGWGGTDGLLNVEGAQGSDFNDTLIGGVNANSSDANWQVFEGGAGNDLIDGADGFVSGIPGIVDNDLDASEYRNAPGAVYVDLAGGTANDGYGTVDTLVGIEMAVGSRFNDTIVGGGSDALHLRFEAYNGRAGDDSFAGGSGNDWLIYEEDSRGVTVNLAAGTATDGWDKDFNDANGFQAGTDTFTGMEHVIGSQYDDLLIGSAADNFMHGDDGDDTLRGGAGNDTLGGGNGNGGGTDLADYSTAAGAVLANLATGHVSDGDGGNDVLTSIEDLRGSAYNDTLTGDQWDSKLEGGAGNDLLDGNGGPNWASYEHDAGGALVDLAAQTATDGFGGTDKLVSIQNVVGSAFGDTLSGSAGDNTLEGGAGNDLIDGLGGFDTLSYRGASGGVSVDLVADTASGAAGNDSFSNIENVIGSQFADTITGATPGAGQREYLQGGGGEDSITGGGAGSGGMSILSFADQNNSIYFDLSSGGGSGTVYVDGTATTFANIQGVVGGSGFDYFTGSGGNDYFEGGAGWDSIFGGEGIDIASYRDAINPIIANLSGGPLGFTYVDALGKSHGTQNVSSNQVLEDYDDSSNNFNTSYDTLSAIENIEGGAYNDTIWGGLGNNVLMGGGGNDSFVGGGGFSTDTLIGGTGSDSANYGFGASTGAIVANLALGTVTKGTNGTDTIVSIEQIVGTGSADTMIGAHQAYTGISHDNVFEAFSGLAGDDSIAGTAFDGQYDIAAYSGATAAVTVNLGSNSASGGAGNDVLLNIDDAVGSAFNDTLIGGSSSYGISHQFFESFRGQAGNDSIDGSFGEDRVDYRFSTGAVNVTLGTGTANGTAIDGQGGIDTLKNVENVRGSMFSDVLTGGGTQNAGTIYDYEVFEGMEGNDTINGGAGTSTDIASYFSSETGVVADLALGYALDGFGTRDTLIGIEQVNGSDFADLFIGSNSLTVRESFRGGAGNDTIFGGAGNDAAFYNGSPNAVVVNLATGVALDGFGDTDTLINIEGVRGSIFNDTLLGGTGNESFEGIQGNDSIDGGAGNDRVDYNRDQDAIVVNMAAGTATSAFSGTDTFVNIEAVRGTGLNDTLIGGVGTFTMEGGGGNDSLSGAGGNAFASYRNSAIGVQVDLGTGTVSDGVDKDAVTAGVQAGTDSLVSMRGAVGSDFNDTFFGGATADTLVGGLGNDIYTVGTGDTVVEVLNEGIDVVNSSVDYVLGDNIENLTLTGTSSIAGAGNILNNLITGNAGNNTLDGGAGSDTLAGGAGNDTYFIDRGSDLIVEATGAGIDTVILASGYNPSAFIVPGGAGADITPDAPINFTLVNNLENMTVAGPTTVVNVSGGTSTTANFLVGGSFGDTLDGGGGNDTLDGGQGIDVLKGGAGNDVFYIRNIGDTAVEAASGGLADTVISSLVITTLGAEIENLTLQNDISITIGRGNAGNNFIKGNSFDNSLFGNDGNDTLDGGGGNDRLYGGAGSDSYVVDGGDIVIEVSGSKSDQALVKQTVDLRTSVGIEGAAAQANIYGIDITGNKQGNKINGNETNNRLDGGKAGKVATNDTLDGGLGSDTYVISSMNDKIIDTGGTGDAIETDFSISLATFGTVENLYQIGSGNIVGGGNALANLLRGNTGNNLLTGMDGADDLEGNAGNDTLDGGKGNDRLYGGDGNDTYVLDSATDVFFETVRFETVIPTGSSGLQPATVISNDGRYIQFTSSANNLVAGDTNSAADTFVKDMQTGTLTRVSSGDTGVLHSAINPGGRFVAFTTTSSLVATDTNGLADVYLRDWNPPTGTTASTTLLSRATTGQADGASVMSDISSDGRFVAISSNATNLVVGDTNSFKDIFLVDRLLNTLVRVSVGDDESQANADAASGVAISANGNFVAFGSAATNLADGGNSAVGHIFVRDVAAGTTELVSVDSAELEANAASSNARISNDGRYVVFESAATNLVVGDTNGASDIFVRDRALGTTVRVSQDAANGQADGASTIGSISADGRYVVFQSDAPNLVIGDSNGKTDVFIKDLTTGAIARVSMAVDGTQANVNSVAPDISEDGRYIVYTNGTTVVRIANSLITGQGGIDTVVTPFTHALGDEFENLTLSGTAAVNGTGTDFDNVLTGNSAANVLTGKLGNDTYVVGAGDTLVDTGGIDTVIASVNWTLGADFENLTLAGTTTLSGTGNGANNLIRGNAAANTLTGMGGSDTLEGGAGNDVYVSDGSDTITELAAGGTDTLQNTASVDLTLVLNVENVLLLGGGSIDATGNAGANLLTGNTGNNVLDGRGGDDTMVGLAGNDTYYVDSAKDVVTEAGTDTGDTVIASITYSLGATVENLTFTGSDNLSGTGNASANSMTGNSGNNILDGKAGNDTMAGGDGADVYFVDSTLDVVTESASADIDEVRSTASFTLGNFVERLVLLGAAAASAIGNALDNFLGGNTGANTLDGGLGNDTLDGGTGADSLSGGAGNDLYFVDNTGDVIATDAVGDDNVFSSVSYAMAGGLDNLTLTGTAANATGNAEANVLTGNSANNVLAGGGGADTMIGGAGNDTYVAETGDLVIESAGGGTDLVQADANISIDAWTNVENLTLTGTNSISGTGNLRNNLITGNAGNNTLDGGTGSDTLVGGDGNDYYKVDAVGDVVTETGTGTADTVESTVNYTLGATVENLVLGGIGDINGTGNAGNNVLTGNAGDNYLKGGDGADTLIGGGGLFDVADYAGTATSVTINLGTHSASGGGGADSIGADIEGVRGGSGNDTLTGSGTGSFVDYSNATIGVTVNLNGTTAVTGGAGIGTDTIVNFGGVRGSAFNDSLTGTTGDDFFFATANDTIDGGGGGNDTVYADTTFAINASLDNLTLIGTGDINATGNDAANILTGNAGDNYLKGNDGNDTLIGGGGSDVADYSGGGAVTVDLVAGTATGTGIGNDSIDADIEGVRGSSSADTLTGGANDLVDYSNFGGPVLVDLVLDNGGGNDVLAGFGGIRGSNTGADTLTGDGNDNFFYVTAGDVVTGGGGNDTIFSAANFVLPGDVESLILTGSGAINGTGNGADNLIAGNSGANSLAGAGGNDTLNGGAGSDTLDGGAGNDLYIVDAAGDIIVADTDGTNDRVESSVNFTLTAGLENLAITGDALTATGNAGNNSITGNAGSNTLDGGAGADTVEGGAGNDTFLVDSDLDQVSDSDGFDVVLANLAAGATFTLGAGLDNLTLTGTANSGGIGNSLNNLITGNDGNNTLDGGAGADTMIGGKGNDTYTVDSLGDVVTEIATGGVDTLRTAFNATLAVTLENLAYTGGANWIGTGNAAANSITGGAGNDTLSGGGGNDGNDTLDGGLGNDLLTGGNGNDTYVVDSLNDVINEAAGTGSGTDLVQAKINLTLAANLENLAYVGAGDWIGTGNELNNVVTGGSFNDSLLGAAGNDTLLGGDGNDTLDGGIGIDSMSGGAGNDTYVIDLATDKFSEALNAGTDTLVTPFTTTMVANFENLTLSGIAAVNATGNDLVNVLTGNEAANLLSGLGADDSLVGGGGADTLDGGAGNDTMAGGLGDDRYVLDSVTDVATEAASAGTDTVVTGLNGYTLQSDLENLVLTGTAVTGNGNGLDNFITGNASANTLTGGLGNDTLDGGTGSDFLLGGNGNDSFIFDANDTSVGAVVGGFGNDSLVFAGAGQTLNLTTAGVSERFDGIERVDIGGSAGINTFIFDFDDIRDLSNESDVVRIDGDLFDVVRSEHNTGTEHWELLGVVPDGDVFYIEYMYTYPNTTSITIQVNQDLDQFIS